MAATAKDLSFLYKKKQLALMERNSALNVISGLGALKMDVLNLPPPLYDILENDCILLWQIAKRLNEKIDKYLWGEGALAGIQDKVPGPPEPEDKERDAKRPREEAASQAEPGCTQG